MLSLLKRTDNGGGQTGIHRRIDGLATAQLTPAAGGGKPVLAHCGFEPANDAEALARAVHRLPNRRLPAVSVLPASRYSMLLVEAPDVPADELRAAVRWRIKDLIDFHIDDAVLDVFQMPSRGRDGPNKMMYAVAARADGVQQEVVAIENSGLRLRAIDVLELSLRNIACQLDADGRGAGLLYLARRLETGVQDLAAADALRSELVAGLALEARRSLDYFESHYEQSAVPVIHTAGLRPADLDQMTGELGLPMRNFELASWFDTAADHDEDTSRRCLPAIGAALRHDQVAL